MRDVQYVVSGEDGRFAADWRKEIVWCQSPEDAALFTRAGALNIAWKINGQAWSYNLDTRKLRRVNS